MSLFLVPVARLLQLSIKIAHLEWFPDVNDIGRELDKGYMDGSRSFNLRPASRCCRAVRLQAGASMAWGARHLIPRRSRTKI